MKVLVTGANGFVGGQLCKVMLRAGYEVKAALRHDDVKALPTAVTQYNIGELSSNTIWREAMEGVDVIVHLAGRVHVMNETESNPVAAYRRLNVEATRHLAVEAVRRGIRRIILLSSIKVNGDSTCGRPFTADDVPAPKDPYGSTKRDAEIELELATKGTKTEFVVFRAPLVYGPGVKGNFRLLIEAIASRRFLPLGAAIGNRRSFVYIGNLCSAIIIGLYHPAAADKTFLVSDGEDMSTAELICRIAKALGVKTRLVAVPLPFLLLASKTWRVGPRFQRLISSLQMDCEPLHRTLGWQPPFGVDEGLKITADWFKSQEGKQNPEMIK